MTINGKEIDISSYALNPDVSILYDGILFDNNKFRGCVNEELKKGCGYEFKNRIFQFVINLNLG